MSRRGEILAKVAAVPALPVAAVKAIGVLQNPHADLCEIVRVVAHDQALTANVLRLANSAAIGGQRKIDSIEMAVARLGTRRILDLVVGSAVRPLAAAAIRGYDLPPGDLWKHSVAVGVGTEELQRVLRLPTIGFAFTAGLLIDVGKVVLGSFLEVDGEPIRRHAFEQRAPFDCAERRVLGVDHAEVGAALMEHWCLPPALIAAVRWHHAPQHCPDEYRPVTDLVHASDQICTTSGIGAGSDGCNYSPCAETLARLRLDVCHIEAALCRIVERLDSLSDLIGTNQGNV